MIDRSHWVTRNVLVTGGAGFIGSHLVEKLVAVSAAVTVLDDFSTGSRENLAQLQGNVDSIGADIREIAWERVIGNHRYDTIFHLAANAYVPPSVERPAWDYAVNMAGTFKLLEALRMAAWKGDLIYVSSAAVYGNPAQVPIHEDDPTIPISPYGVGKLASERYVSVYSQLYGLKAASLRLFSVYGPRQRKQVVYDLIGKIKRNSHELFIHGDGTQVRDFNYVGDTVQAAMLVAERGRLAGEVYNVASGKPCSIRELVEVLCHILDVQPTVIYSGSVRPGDAERWTVDLGRLSSLGYVAGVPLIEGLQQTVRWYEAGARMW